MCTHSELEEFQFLVIFAINDVTFRCSDDKISYLQLKNWQPYLEIQDSYKFYLATLHLHKEKQFYYYVNGRIHQIVQLHVLLNQQRVMNHHQIHHSPLQTFHM